METITTRLAERSEKLEQVSFYGWPVVAFFGLTIVMGLEIKRRHGLSFKDTLLVLIGRHKAASGEIAIFAGFACMFAVLAFQVWLLQNCRNADDQSQVSADFPALCWR